jgi:hypothetical protein
MSYSKLFVLVKIAGPGHAFVAFGNSNPEIVFNQSGADGSSSVSGETARLSKVSWDDAKNYFITGSDKYYGFVVANSDVMKAYNYANKVFEDSPVRKGDPPNRHRNRSYNIATQNCASLTRDICKEAGIWTMSLGIWRPHDVMRAMGEADIYYSNVSQWGVVERTTGGLTFSGGWGLLP